MKLLTADDVTLFPVSSRSALEAKLSYSKNSDGKHSTEAMYNDPRWRSSKFFELEDYLLSFLDSSTENGKERVRLKLETPIGIADRLLTSCQRLVKLEYEKAVEDLASIKDLVYGANNYAIKLKSDSSSWQNQISSLVGVSNTTSYFLFIYTNVLPLLPKYKLCFPCLQCKIVVICNL